MICEAKRTLHVTRTIVCRRRCSNRLSADGPPIDVMKSIVSLTRQSSVSISKVPSHSSTYDTSMSKYCSSDGPSPSLESSETSRWWWW